MDLLTLNPLIMLLAFSLVSFRRWKNPVNSEAVFMVCMGWAAIAVLSLSGGIMLFVVRDYVVAIFLLLLSPAAAYVATRFRDLN
ncbi:hypothetical protein [Neptunicella marina]|uniref:Uncharacterized protein n=1 Tax=Neptunicella marina TaxID=2125989 RepID=A0A8J6IPP4_9ALTE|nr:hypothetical protein [Neptunicella marina]MBC3765565.1 hypothetical protein [Neptunicella marina]